MPGHYCRCFFLGNIDPVAVSEYVQGFGVSFTLGLHEEAGGILATDVAGKTFPDLLGRSEGELFFASAHRAVPYLAGSARLQLYVIGYDVLQYGGFFDFVCNFWRDVGNCHVPGLGVLILGIWYCCIAFLPENDSSERFFGF